MRSYMFVLLQWIYHIKVPVSSFCDFICTCMYLIYNYEVLIMWSSGSMILRSLFHFTRLS